MPTYVTNQGPIVADAPDPSWKLSDNGIYLLPLPAITAQDLRYDTTVPRFSPTPQRAMASVMNLIENLPPQAGLESAAIMNGRE